MAETPHLLKNNFIGQGDRIVKHIIDYAQLYFILFLTLIIGAVFLFRYLQGNPVIFGQESYYLLSFFEQFFPVSSKVLRLGLFGLNFIISMVSIILGYSLTRKLKWDRYLQFFFMGFIVVSPAFMYITSSISHFSLTLCLLLVSLFLVQSQREIVRLGAALPLIAIATFDALSAFIGILTLILFYPYSRKERTFMVLSGGLLVVTIVLWFITTPLTQSIIPYPIKSVSQISSDLGSYSGVSLFLLLLSFLGLLFWDKNYWKVLAILLLVSLTFLFNPTFIIFIAIIVSYLAARGVVMIFDRKWTLEALKGFTLLLIGLGLLFSTLTYTQRLIEVSPTQEEYYALTFIKANTDENAIVFTDPNQAVYVTYFATRTPYVLTSTIQEKEAEYQAITKAGYIGQLFPLLEQNSISIIYITPSMKEHLGSEQGILFLLKNERFKMLYSLDNTEVWLFSSSE